ADVRWVVVDEVHALASCKRGSDLALSLERLDEVAGARVQRIGLSATCAPLAEAAGFLAGAGRPCAVACVADGTPVELAIEPLPATGAFLQRLTERVASEIERHRSTLVFTNVRSTAERLAWALRQRFPRWADAIGVHHSALAPERRRLVERGLK